MDDKEAFCEDGIINIGSDAWYDWKVVPLRELWMNNELMDLLRESFKKEEAKEDWLNVEIY